MGQRGGLGGLPVPLVVVCAGGMQSTCFCSWFFRSGSWAFRSRCLLWSIICPSAQARRCHQTLQFFVTRGVVGPGAWPAARASQSQPIPLGLPRVHCCWEPGCSAQVLTCSPVLLTLFSSREGVFMCFIVITSLLNYSGESIRGKELSDSFADVVSSET